ncbi:Mg2+ and Co2+ transporter [Paraferrimonas haliotis]|uniref:Mg2+ and Co2+ transporter n=1 Tax=Paraferrimonas haliotis TaxID=2013866 RepID=A0AA37TU56_9GAMM|nr:Mg2+ and Co2+ transporter [Paraferrimonas haliotis]GLS82795.1 hypothetical protein GCM10007894_07720 [Paraferrimonas haliotis]
MKIHPSSLEFEQLPSVYPLLDSVGFMWFVILVTLGIVIWCIAKLWQVHSIPKKLAKERGMSQASLVFWLCIMGLFVKPLWIIAVLIIVTDWDKIQQWIKGAQA